MVSLRRIGDNDEAITVVISTVRSLGDFESLLNHFRLHRLREVKGFRTVRVVVSR